MAKKKLANRKMTYTVPAGGIPTRMDADISILGDPLLKSGAANMDDIPLIRISSIHHMDTISISPEIGPGYFFIKNREGYLMPTDSVSLSLPDSDDGTYAYYSLDSLPKPGYPIKFYISVRDEIGKEVSKISFIHVPSFSTTMVDGVETPDLTKKEFVIDYENSQIIVPLAQLSISNVYTAASGWLETSIRDNTEFLGVASGASMQTYVSKYAPIRGADICVYCIEPNGNILVYEHHRDINHDGVQGSATKPICQITPEYGIVNFGPTYGTRPADLAGVPWAPVAGSEIFLSYRSYPVIEYVPEYSREVHIAQDLNLSPIASGLNRGVVQITNSEIMAVTSLELTSDSPILDPAGSVYGPLQIGLDYSPMQCKALNAYGEPIPNIAIQWHFSPNIGTINNLTADKFISTITNFLGDTWATYVTPYSYSDLETEFAPDSTDTTYLNGTRTFTSEKFQVYSKEHVLVYHTYIPDESSWALRKSSSGYEITKLVNWHEETSINGNIMEVAEVIRPVSFNAETHTLNYLGDLLPDIFSLPAWEDIAVAGETLEVGTKIKTNSSNNLYYEVVDTGVFGSSPTKPTFTTTPGDIIEDGDPSNPIYWKCKEIDWMGWAVYTDRLVEVYCTAVNTITGQTIESNRILLDVTLPLSWIGLYGFRFDTVPQSLMDIDGLTI